MVRQGAGYGHQVDEWGNELRPGDEGYVDPRMGAAPGYRSGGASDFTPGGGGLGGPAVGGGLGGGLGGGRVGGPAEDVVGNEAGAQRAADLFWDKDTLVEQLLKSMGLSPGSQTPLARYTRSRAPSASTAWMLDKGPNEGASLTNPEAFVSFARQQMGGGGNYMGKMMDALTQANRGGENNVWNEFLQGMYESGPDTGHERLTRFIGDAFGAQTAGSFNPFRSARFSQLNRAPAEFKRQQTMGEVPSGEEYMGWIAERLGKMLGIGGQQGDDTRRAQVG